MPTGIKSRNTSDTCRRRYGTAGPPIFQRYEVVSVLLDKRAKLVFAIILEFVLVAGLLSVGPAESPQLPVLYARWKNNPTPETERAWKSESDRVHRIENVTKGTLAILALVNGAFIWSIRRRMRGAGA